MLEIFHCGKLKGTIKYPLDYLSWLATVAHSVSWLQNFIPWVREGVSLLSPEQRGPECLWRDSDRPLRMAWWGANGEETQSLQRQPSSGIGNLWLLTFSCGLQGQRLGLYLLVQSGLARKGQEFSSVYSEHLIDSKIDWWSPGGPQPVTERLVETGVVWR